MLITKHKQTANKPNSKHHYF